jgi:hypothetical protein
LGCDLNSPEDDDEIPDDDWTIPDPDPGGEATPIDPETPIDDDSGGGSVPGDGGEDGLPEPDLNPDDEVDGYEAGIYFHSATWSELDLTIAMRLAPTGKAPRDDLGALDVTIASTSVVALLPNGQLANPQPSGLPSVSFSGQIAAPWDATAEGLPVPPADRVFEGQFVITFTEGDFPPVAEDPTEQLTYRATVEFTDWEGGFTDVSFLNTLTVDFEGAAEPEVNELVIYYPDTAPPLATIEGVTIEEIANDVWSTFSFQGVNALEIPSNSSGNTTWWIIDFASESFNTELGSLTVEFFARIGTNATNDNNNKTSGWLAQLRNSNESERVAVIGEFDADPFYRILAVNDSEVYPEGADFYTYQQSVTSEAAATMKHFSLQLIEGAQIIAHFDGTKVYDSSRTVSPMRYLFFYIFANEVSGTAISQIRITKSARYGTGNFTPPSTAFYVPPS